MQGLSIILIIIAVVMYAIAFMLARKNHQIGRILKWISIFILVVVIAIKYFA